MRGKIVSAAVFALVLTILSGPCSTATLYVDTIGDGSLYQIGRELAKTIQVGYDSHPFSGDFTGARPTHDLQGVGENYNPYAVVRDGTSGVPCAALLRTDAQGKVYMEIGAFGAWVVQPFTPSQSGTVKYIDLVAQVRQSAGASQQVAPEQRKLTIFLLGAGMSALPCPPYCPATCDVSKAHVGSIVTAVVPNGWSLNSGHTYYLMIGVGEPGSWSYSGTFYANLNWASRQVVPDAARVGETRLSITTMLTDL